MEKPEKLYVSYLDGLRGGAALWVLVAHCMIWSGWYGYWFPDPKIAVDVFMVISGYLMVHTWRPGAARFWTRRFFRIAPAYYLCFASAALLAPWYLGGYAVLHQNPRWAGDVIYDPRLIHFTPANWLMHLTFLFGLVPRWSFSAMLPDWSISLEMQFYAVFPVLLSLIRRRGWFWPTLGLVAVSLLIGRANYHLLPIRAGAPPGYPEPSFLPLKLPLFLVGMLAAEAVQQQSIGLSIASLILCAGVAHPLVSFAAGCLVYLGLMPSEPLSIGLRRVLGSPFTAFLAEVSYCVYLFHGFCIAFIGGWLFQQNWFLRLPEPAHFVLLLAGVLPTTYLLAIAVNRTVELPGIALGRRVIRAFPTGRTVSR